MESCKSGILSKTKDVLVRKNEGYLKFNRILSVTEAGRLAREVEYSFVRQRDIGEHGASVFSADVAVVIMLELCAETEEAHLQKNKEE